MVDTPSSYVEAKAQPTPGCPFWESVAVAPSGPSTGIFTCPAWNIE